MAREELGAVGIPSAKNTERSGRHPFLGPFSVFYRQERITEHEVSCLS